MGALAAYRPAQAGYKPRMHFLLQLIKCLDNRACGKPRMQSMADPFGIGVGRPLFNLVNPIRIRHFGAGTYNRTWTGRLARSGRRRMGRSRVAAAFNAADPTAFFRAALPPMRAALPLAKDFVARKLHMPDKLVSRYYV